MRNQYFQFSEPVTLLKEIDGAISSLFGTAPVSLTRGTKSWRENGNANTEARHAFYPALNMWENENDIRLELEVPGVEPSQVEVTIEGNVLTVKGERAESRETNKESAGGTCKHSEWRFGSFLRELELPETVNTETVRADHKNGVLTITLAKQERSTPRKVPVNAAS